MLSLLFSFDFKSHSHRRIGVTSQSCSTPISHRSGTVPPLSIPARTFRLIPAKQAIPPPPPYHASVRNAIHRNEINQITTQIQQSCSTNVFNVSASSSNSSSSSSSSSTLTTNINASSSSLYLNQNSINRLDKIGSSETVANEENHLNGDDLVNSNDFENDNENIDEISSEIDGDENEFVNNNDTSNEKTTKSNEHRKPRTKHQQQQDKDNAITSGSDNNKETCNFKEENVDTSIGDAEPVSGKRTRGLKVLSNVQVSPNAILNVSLNSTNNETIPLNNMIIVSSLPSTSTGTTSQVLPTQLLRTQSLLKTLNESRSPSETKNPKHTKANTEVSVKCF